jgi:hypothetical protein
MSHPSGRTGFTIASEKESVVFRLLLYYIYASRKIFFIKNLGVMDKFQAGFTYVFLSFTVNLLNCSISNSYTVSVLEAP